MSTPRKQRHVAQVEAFATVTDERLAELIRAIDRASRENQSALAALKAEQRRRRRTQQGRRHG